MIHIPYFYFRGGSGKDDFLTGLKPMDTIGYNVYRRSWLGFLSIFNVPKKIRELKAMLRKAGFMSRSGKGSHTVWGHPTLRDKIALSGADGDDADFYQEKDVREILRKLKEVQGE